jgi:hypothetical protein
MVVANPRARVAQEISGLLRDLGCENGVALLSAGIHQGRLT